MAARWPKFLLGFAIGFICLTGQSYGAEKYLGKFLGKLSELHHGVSGEIYVVDARTLHIKDFTYDGEGPAAYFWAGSTRSPGSSGFRVPDENGSTGVLKRYRRKSITLTLPDGKTLNNIKWFSVWCDEFAVNFGDVKIPRNYDYPKPQKIDGLRGVHGVSSDNIVIVDAQTLLIPNFSYDGEAPDAKFWVGRGSKPSPQGIRVPDENGKEVPLRRYDRKTVVLTLPGDLTIFDIGHFGVWCEAFTVDFGHVRIPQQLNVPPSLKMLGVSPQSKLNCEVLYDDLAFEVRWAVAGESIVIQLVAKLEDNEYMSFGLSGNPLKSEMISGDVVVSWVDKSTLKGYAEDYFLEAKSQCSGPRGSCPDERIFEKSNNIRLLNAAMVNGYSIVTYQRPLKPSDELDKQIYTNQSQAIIWAIGPLNQRNEVSFHSHYLKKDHFLDFGRTPRWNCPMPESDSSSQQSQNAAAQTAPPPLQRRKPEASDGQALVESTTRGRTTERRRVSSREPQVIDRRDDITTSNTRRRTTTSRSSTTSISTPRSVPTPKPVSNRNAWYIPPIQCYEPDDGVFYAQMGPTGGKRGYPAITGHVGWGISWYINGLLIPEINVVRGRTYTFVVEGGLDPEVPAKYHPFYITDDPVGGYEYKTPEERENVRIFAGVKQTKDDKVYPVGVGRLCHWTHTGDKEADEFPSFGAFQRTLELRCDPGEPGVITWTPDQNTPDTVYYQCFTHRYLGWKINVLDECNEQPEGSEPEAAVAYPDLHNGDLKSSSSIIVETRVKPNDLFQTTKSETSVDNSFHFGPDAPPSNHFQSSPELFHDPSADAPFNVDTEPEDDLLTTKITENATTPTTAAPKENGSTVSPSISPASSSPTPVTKPFRRPQKPMFFSNKPPMRRPILPHHPPYIMKPMMLTMHRPPPHQNPYKKSFYRIPLRKRPAAWPRPKPSNTNQEPIIIMKYQPPASPPIKLKTTSPTPPKKVIPASSELISVKKDFKKESTTLQPAVNTGFNPESIVIEGGFKPIISKEIQDRILEDNFGDSNQEEDIGVIRLNSEITDNNNQQYIKPFEPMFIPSPPDSHLLLNKKQNFTKSKLATFKKSPPLMFVVKHVPRSAELINEQEDEPIAMAAERVESYYLPPEDRKIKPVERVRKPSNIDIPAGTVVTFDGKTVSGVSLTAPALQTSNFESRSSKAAELLRLSPQFGPFKGEIPPLDTQNINTANLPQLSSQAVINRDLNAPAPAPAFSSVQTTKLSPVRSYQRSKRSPHHTPEHTAEQEKQKQQKSNSSRYFINYNLVCVITLTFITNNLI